MASGRGRRAAAALVAVALLAACTGGDDPEPAAGPTTSRAESTGDPAPAVRLGIGDALEVDPAAASLASPTELMVIDLLYDGLTRLDADGVAQPALAARWHANAGRTAFAFDLDRDATFASGRRVTPTDVIASWERVLAAGDTSLPALSLEAVKGFRAFVEGEAEHVSGLTAPDDDTVHVALTTPLSVLPAIVASPIFSVVDVESLREHDPAVLDLSGSWAVASADDAGLRVERRDGAGDLEAVELRTYTDEEAAYDGFDAEEVDWAAVPSSRYDAAVDDHGTDAFAPFHAELFFGMNLGSPTLATPALRRAIQLAIDREAIVEAVYADLADPLPTIVPAGVDGHDPERCEPCAYDPVRAAEIISFAYGADAPVIHIDFDASGSQREMAALIAEDLDEVGIPTELRPLPLDDYKRFVVSGNQELFSFGWIGAYRSPDAYLAPLFGSAANDNLTSYRSARVDRLLERARIGADPNRNPVDWAEAEEEVLIDAVVVPIAQFRTQVVVADRVKGLAHAVDGTVDWAQVRLTG
ncbi:MAG: ABC transporter substrate-binding protein [Acidimicrobiales bacterium]